MVNRSSHYLISQLAVCTGLIFTCFDPSLSLAQSKSIKRMPSLPDSCAYRLVGLQSTKGTVTYLRLRYVIEALDSGQESISIMRTGLKDFDAVTSPALGMAQLLTVTQQAQDALHCSAFVIDQYRAIDTDDKTIKVILASAFNREADAVATLMAHFKSQFLRPAAENEKASTQMRDAEKMAANNAAQTKAATDLLETTGFVLARSVDLSDQNAKTTPYLAVTCAEYADLLRRNEPIAHADKTAYSDAAALVQSVLEGHKCRALDS